MTDVTDYDAELARQRWLDCQAERKAWDKLVVTLDHLAGHAIEWRLERFGDGCGGAVIQEWIGALERHLGRPLVEASWPQNYTAPVKRKPLTTTECLAVFAKDDYMCQRCGTREDLTVDHIHPVSKGGTNDPENLQALCKRCNSGKRDRI